MSIVSTAWRDGLRPDPMINIVEWSNTYRYLSQKGASEHGKYDMSRMPFLIEIAKALSPDSLVQFVFVCKGIQLGFTELGNNMFFTYADLYPCPMLMVFPVKNLLLLHLDNKFWSGVKASPRLLEKIRPVKQGAVDSSSTSFIKFSGGSILGAWSESKSTFASGSYRVAHLSDVDRFLDDVGGEGDTVALTIKRLASFKSKRKLFVESSPTKKRSSKIYNEAMNGDQNYYNMHCPDCDEMVIFLEDGFTYNFDKETYELIDDVKFACSHCGSLIEEYQKFDMMKIENGAKWIPANPNYRNKVRKTYFIGGYYSPFLTWNEIFTEYLEALKEKDTLGRTHKLKVWYNTLDGTVYSDDKDDKEIPVELKELLERREDYSKVPKDVVLLSAGIDTQGNRWEVTILGWINSRERYVIGHYIVAGDPKDLKTQKELDRLLFDTFFPLEDGSGSMKIFCSAIDTGGNKTDHIYNYVRLRPRKNLYAIKGGKSIDDPLVKTFSEVFTKRKKPVKLWVLGVNSGKDDVIEDLKEEFGTRYLHFPKNIRHFWGDETIDMDMSDEGYFQQLLEEKQNSDGRWINEHERPNEGIDCLVYADASTKIRGVNIDKLAKINKKAYFKKG